MNSVPTDPLQGGIKTILLNLRSDEILVFSGISDQVWPTPREIQKVLFEPIVARFPRVLCCESHMPAL